MICFDSELFPQNFVWHDSSIMIEKASNYTMNALNKSSELWHTSVNRKARPVVEGEHDKSWNDHGFILQSLQHQTCFLFYTSHSAYVATETELVVAKIDGLLPPNFL